MSPITTAVVAADSATNAEAKLTALQTARFELSRLTQRAKVAGIVPAETSASVAILRLSNEGIQRDILSYRIVLTALSQLSSTADAAQRNSIENEIRGTAEGLENLAYRAGAFFSIGDRLIAAGSSVRARAYTTRLLQMAAGAADPDQRIALGTMAARLAAQTDGLFAPQVSDALAYVPDIRSRSALVQLIARVDLREDMAKSDSDRAVSIAARLQEGDYRAATALSMTLDIESEARATNLILCSQKAIEAEDFQVARMSLLALSTKRDQRQAFEKIAGYLAERGLLLQSLSVLDGLADEELRVNGYAEVATQLDKRGYKDLASLSFDRGLSSAQLIGPDQVAYIARSMANSGREEDAARIALALPASSSRSQALSAATRRFAASGQIAKAEALLPQVSESSDYSAASSAIASAQARAGDVHLAKSALDSLAVPKDADRVRLAIAQRLAADRDLAGARAAMVEISTATIRLQAILSLIREAHQAGDTGTSKSDLGSAVEIARAAHGNDRDQMLLDIVQTVLGIGDLAAASSIADGIEGQELRDRAQAIIAEALARAGQYPEALQQLDGIQGGYLRDEARARATLAALGKGVAADDGVKTLSTLDDPTLRRASLRTAAEQLARVNDPLGLLGGTRSLKGTDPADTGLARTDRTPARLGNGITLTPAEGAPSGFAKLSLPDLGMSADDLRATMPAPSALVDVSTGIMTDAGHFTKFFEDLDGGRTGADQTIEAQQLPAPQFVLVKSGVVTLGSLAGRLAGTITSVEGAVSVNAPILVAPNATLIISGLEAREFRLNSARGAFIVNAGRLIILDAKLASWDEKNNRPDYRVGKAGEEAFRPFIVSWSGSATEVGGSHLIALGYHAPKAFGLAITAGPSVLTKKYETDKRPTATIVDNTIENFEYGFYSYEADYIQTIGNDYHNNIVYAVDPHDRSRSLIFAFNTTRGTQLKHGIIGSREVNEGYIVGNLSFDNKGSGFMLDRSSIANIVYANYSFANKQDGISLFESACNLIVGNRLERNQRAGIKVRNSWDVGVYHNEILGNRAAGIEGYIVDLTRSPGSEGRDYELDPYSPVTTFAAGWNVIERNGAGITMSGASGASLIDNTFRFPNRKLMGGDALGATVPVLQNPGGVLIESTCKPRPQLARCPLREKGLLGDELLDSFASVAATNDCTGAEGSPQSTAFSNVLNPS